MLLTIAEGRGRPTSTKLNERHWRHQPFNQRCIWQAQPCRCKTGRQALLHPMAPSLTCTLSHSLTCVRAPAPPCAFSFASFFRSRPGRRFPPCARPLPSQPPSPLPPSASPPPPPLSSPPFPPLPRGPSGTNSMSPATLRLPSSAAPSSTSTPSPACPSSLAPPPSPATRSASASSCSCKDITKGNGSTGKGNKGTSPPHPICYPARSTLVPHAAPNPTATPLPPSAAAVCPHLLPLLEHPQLLPRQTRAHLLPRRRQGLQIGVHRLAERATEGEGNMRR